MLSLVAILFRLPAPKRHLQKFRDYFFQLWSFSCQKTLANRLKARKAGKHLQKGEKNKDGREAFEEKDLEKQRTHQES